MQLNPTREYTITKGGESIFEKIYKSFNSEIDYIRTKGSCSDCGEKGQLRFGNYHVLKHADGRIAIHYDRYNAVTSPTRHYFGDFLFNW